MSMIRTHALPAIWTRNGSTNSAAAASRNTTSFCWRLASLKRVIAIPSGAVGDTLAEQPLRPEREDEDEDHEGEDVLVVAAQDAAGQRADVAGAERFNQPEQDTTDHRPGQVADAAEDRCRERLQ